MQENFQKHICIIVIRISEYDIPQILVRKVSDEQSHADGDLESHNLPFDEPETIAAAKLILERLEAIDKEQYEALIESIS